MHLTRCRVYEDNFKVSIYEKYEYFFKYAQLFHLQSGYRLFAIGHTLPEDLALDLFSGNSQYPIHSTTAITFC